MNSKVPTREEAFRLLTEYNKNESLIKHALAVEAVMRYFARKRGEDEDKWGVIGLIHDLDYEQFPDQHCHKTEEILRYNDWPGEYIRAVVSHGWSICTDVEPQTELEKVLFAIDEPKIQPASDQEGEPDSSIIFNSKSIVLIYVIGFVSMVVFFLVPVHLPFYLTTLTGASNSLVGMALAAQALMAAIVSLQYRRVKARFSFQSISSLVFLSIVLLPFPYFSCSSAIFVASP